MEELEKKRIALLGLGVENRSVGRYLAGRGIGFSICDARSEDELPEAGTWRHLARSWHLGSRYLESLDEFDLIFRTPGISILNPALVKARQKGTVLHSQTRLFFERCPAPIVGITGTKGKGTTCSLLFEMLRDGPYGQVWLGGNIGTPPMEFFDDVSVSDLVILELSSFQLQDLDRSPPVAVVLNVTADHLDYHVEAKKSICRNQSEADILIVDADCETASTFASDSAARRMEFSLDRPVETGAFLEEGQLWARPFGAEATPLCRASDLKLRGRSGRRSPRPADAPPAILSRPGAPPGVCRHTQGRRLLQRLTGNYSGGDPGRHRFIRRACAADRGGIGERSGLHQSRQRHRRSRDQGTDSVGGRGGTTARRCRARLRLCGRYRSRVPGDCRGSCRGGTTCRGRGRRAVVPGLCEFRNVRQLCGAGSEIQGSGCRSPGLRKWRGVRCCTSARAARIPSVPLHRWSRCR